MATFRVLLETIKESRIRSLCFIGIVLLGIIELGLETIVPIEWSGLEVAIAGSKAISVGLFLVAFFPPPSLRGLHYIVFYVSTALLGCWVAIWAIMVSYREMRVPGWLAAVYVTFFLVIFGSLILGERSPRYRLHAVVVVIVILLIAMLVYTLG